MGEIDLTLSGTALLIVVVSVLFLQRGIRRIRFRSFGREKEIVQRQKAMLEKGFPMGKLLYKERRELHGCRKWAQGIWVLTWREGV